MERVFCRAIFCYNKRIFDLNSRTLSPGIKAEDFPDTLCGIRPDPQGAGFFAAVVIKERFYGFNV